MEPNSWPSLPFAEWKETCATLHMWTQIVGKVRLALSPWTNHSWHVTLYLTARGLTTSPIYSGHSPFEIEFDFEDTFAVRHRRSRQASRRNIQSHIPPVINERRQPEPDLTDDLRPHVHSGERVLPVFEDEFGPGVVGHL